MLTPTVSDREHAATRTARRVGDGLDRDHQLVVTVPHVEHLHAIGVEQRIGPGTPARVRTTPTVIHVGVLNRQEAWPLPILKTPTPNSPLRHALPVNHAQIRRARQGDRCAGMSAPMCWLIARGPVG
jgi:hypothetical protein